MKAITKTAAAFAMMAFAAPAFAGGVNVFDDGDSKLKIEGLIFADMTSHNAKTNGVTTTKDIGARVERAYFTIKYNFNSDWMMRITTDMQAGTSALAAAGNKTQNIYLKYAYVQGKLLGDAVVVRFGQSHTPWIDYEQHLWKHRYVAKVTTDYFKFDDSSDLGIGLKGKVAGGLVKYWITETTGNGYDNLNAAKTNTGNSNAMDFNGRIGVYPVKGLTLDVQYRDGYRGNKLFGTTAAKRTLTQAMISYGMGKDFRAGFNWVNHKMKPVVGAVTKDNVMALWGWAKVPGTPVGVFARAETDTTKTAGVNTQKIRHYVGGVEFSPAKGVTFAFAADQKKTDNLVGSTKKDLRWGLYSQMKL